MGQRPTGGVTEVKDSFEDRRAFVETHPLGSNSFDRPSDSQHPLATTHHPSSATPASAATLVATYETRHGPRVILTRRPATLRRHPGQISFPGGMIEPSDESPLLAAIREAHEEIGLRVPRTLSATPLTPVTTLSSGIVILPFWVRLRGSPRLRAAPDEVEAILRVPLVALRAPDALCPIPHPRRPDEQTMAYVWRKNVIWGATAQTVAELLQIYV